ncbi:unnamed protein product [Leptidea sinapis]|uniref:Ig-like domain-containing protein n=1 Tax=Leptidea sinapis TaxID=189913 RepID=A0A5E4QCQ4_9NEOP|nr:unnamed protein product [Leptidea sinapis]
MSPAALITLIGVSVFFKCSDSVDLPRFVGPGSNVTVAVGRDAVFTCSVDNLQTFKVAWLRVDTQTVLTIAAHVITKNHRISVIHGDGTWTLVLRDVTPADGGSYMCQVNTEPMMSQLHELHVVVPPNIDDEASSSDIKLKEGESAALRCVASGTPTPTRATSGAYLCIATNGVPPSVSKRILLRVVFFSARRKRIPYVACIGYSMVANTG